MSAASTHRAKRRDRSSPKSSVRDRAQVGPLHALYRGGYVAAIFCGHRDVLGELAGEPTALIAHKFVMSERSLSAGDDFARSSGRTLPEWPAQVIEPVAGACFVFSDSHNPSIGKLIERGAQAGEHFVIAGSAHQQDDATLRRERLRQFLCRVPIDGIVGILGYGDQGQRIVQMLLDDLDLQRDRLLIWDSNTASAARARNDGMLVVTPESMIERAAAMIATPLARYKRIESLIDAAKSLRKPVLDNARQVSGLQHWRRRGVLFLDEAADRCLSPGNDEDPSIRASESSLTRCNLSTVPAPTAFIVREEARRFDDVEVQCLSGGQRHDFALATAVDLAALWNHDSLTPGRFLGLTRAFVSLRDREDLGFFAARELCGDLWPHATRAIFPSEHVIDLDATAFERGLRDRMDRREIVPTMQTPAQIVALAAAAAHFAVSRPIIEIGSALGGSALIMARATNRHRPPIVSIDPDAPTRDIMRFAFECEGFGDRLRQVVKTSSEAVGDLADLQGMCGLVFIDGLHTAAAVMDDFRNYAPLVAMGGGLAFHDVCPATHSVMQVVVEHVLPDRRFAARCMVDGLLILERVGE